MSFAVVPVGAQEPRGEGAVVVRDMPPKINEEFVVGKVRSVSAPRMNDLLMHSAGIVSRKQIVDLEVLEGPLKGRSFVIQNELTDNPSLNIDARPGREVVLSVVSENGREPEVNIADYHRAPALFVLTAIFLISYIALGGKSGLKSLFGLIAAISLIGFVLLPLSLQGYDPLLTSAGICACAGMATILCVGGFSRKSLAALIGTIGGVIIAGTAAHIVIGAAPLTGLSSEEAQILRGSVLSQPPAFFAGLLAASMLIGALGVIMDVAISVASSVRELSLADAKLDANELYRRGMNVGRDIMGSMTSTLVLAYAGGALPLLMLMAREPSIKFLNLDLVATEVASALTGSLGLVWTIPITAFAASRLMTGHGGGPHGNGSRKDVFEDFPQVTELSPESKQDARQNARVNSTNAIAGRRTRTSTIRGGAG
ncbi:MAG: YibE/F family protein [Candidatus Obscuribacterales bacterium]|nr:YibE/F family protein [Candidatus Obscuribacterales bacterium]